MLEKVAVAPLSNPVPLTVRFCDVAPWPRDVGLTAVTVGAALTVKIEPLVAILPSPFATVKVRGPVAALLDIETFTVSVVAFTKVVERTVMLLPEKAVARLAPLTKSVPVTVKLWFTAPALSDEGDTPVIVGAGLTVKIAPLVPLPASGFVTVMVLDPTVAPPAMVTLTVSVVALTKVVELTVMPVPENVGVAPLTKPVPDTVKA